MSSSILFRLPEVITRPPSTGTFRVSVKGIVAYGDRVLLLRKAEGKWDLPGGRLDQHEDPVAGLVRELQEEIGIEVDSMAVADCAVRRKPGALPILVAFYYCRTRATVDDIRLSPEHVTARLFRPTEIESLKLYRCYKDAIVRAVADHRHRVGRH